MNLIAQINDLIIQETKQICTINEKQLANFEFKINVGRDAAFGDLSCNIAMLLGKQLGLNPRDLALQLQQRLTNSALKELFAQITIAGPGFINIALTSAAWQTVVQELFEQQATFFKLDTTEAKHKYLVEFVSANPTGPLHLGHGRNAIIGDVLARVLSFLGHRVHREFYINDAGNQIKVLGQSFKARCLQALGIAQEMPEEGYMGQYMIDMANDCVAVHGQALKDKPDQFFELYAKEQLLALIKATLTSYGVVFDTWYSEKNLHDSGSIDRAIELLKAKDLAYDKDGALWFKSTAFGDDKDRVIRKGNGELTYIAADIAYHKEKFDRGFDRLVDILGHDHHGYVKRLKATMEALGYPAEHLGVILYQLISLKENDVAVKMSKRAGTFTKLSDIIETVGVDVARFFFLNRKADAALEFDLAVALKKTEENPVYYIQYALVRIKSILHKAEQEGQGALVASLRAHHDGKALTDVLQSLRPDEIELIKKVVSLRDILHSIESSYHTHLLSFYALELAQQFHAYYGKNKVIDASNPAVTQCRLSVLFVVHETLELCLDLLGLSKPEKM